MKVKFKKLVDTAIVPAYAKVGDAGLDMVATKHSINKSSHLSFCC